jgi:hypothetical protein
MNDVIKKEDLDENEVRILHGLHIFIEITGTIIEKRYDKRLKAFIFKVEKDPVFEDSSMITIKKIIYLFGINKKIHRKYRKIIYEGNQVVALGLVRAIFGNESEKGLEPEEYIIDTVYIQNQTDPPINIQEYISKLKGGDNR